MTVNDREQKLSQLAEKRKKAIKSLTNYKESDLPVSAAAEYLTFVAGSGEGVVEVRYENENIWLTKKDGKTYKVKFYALQADLFNM